MIRCIHILAGDDISDCVGTRGEVEFKCFFVFFCITISKPYHLKSCNGELSLSGSTLYEADGTVLCWVELEGWTLTVCCLINILNSLMASACITGIGHGGSFSFSDMWQPPIIRHVLTNKDTLYKTSSLDALSQSMFGTLVYTLPPCFKVKNHTLLIWWW